MASETSEERADNGEGTRIPWALLLEVVGAGAAIAAWIAVVGGARIWARLHTADIPASRRCRYSHATC